MTMGATVSPQVVAQQSLAALGGWWATSRPGWLSKALEFSLMFLPRFGRVRAMAQVMGGLANSAH